MIWLYKQDPIKVGYHPVNFGGQRNCDNGDIVVLVCHVIEGSCDFMTGVYQGKLPSF